AGLRCSRLTYWYQPFDKNTRFEIPSRRPVQMDDAMMRIIVFYFVIASLLAVTAVESLGERKATFWVGFSRAQIVEREVMDMKLRQAVLFACKFAPRQTYAVLIRGNRCYVLNAVHLDSLLSLPVHPGDKIFEYKGIE